MAEGGDDGGVLYSCDLGAVWCSHSWRHGSWRFMVHAWWVCVGAGCREVRRSICVSPSLELEDTIN